MPSVINGRFSRKKLGRKSNSYIEKTAFHRQNGIKKIFNKTFIESVYQGQKSFGRKTCPDCHRDVRSISCGKPQHEQLQRFAQRVVILITYTICRAKEGLIRSGLSAPQEQQTK